MTSVALIGYGGIAQDVAAALREAGGGAKIAGVLCRPGRAAKARAALGDIVVVETLADLLALHPNIVAEVAGQQAVAEHGPEVLRRGFDLLVISVGALAEPALLERLKTAACAFAVRPGRHNTPAILALPPAARSAAATSCAMPP